MNGWLARTMMLGLVLVAAGCFSPKLKNLGFACAPNGDKACPDGYTCINGLCDDGSGGVRPSGGDQDMAMGNTGGNGGSGGGGGGGGGGGNSAPDLAMSMPADMAMPMPPDLAMAPPDLAMGSTCAHDKCTTGAKLKSGCDACVTQICAADSYCCVTTWDSICVGYVGTVCNKTCP